MTPADRAGHTGALFDDLPVPATDPIDPNLVSVAGALASLVAAPGPGPGPGPDPGPNPAIGRMTCPVTALGEQAVVLRGLALGAAGVLAVAIDQVASQARWRRMITPGGLTMSVALTNCGALGWTSDARGYRYSPLDPVSGRPWPALPDAFARLARAAAQAGGFDAFAPDACLVNRYQPGARLSLHQDRNERDFSQPIVAVWGGADRLRFHGIAPVQQASHPLTGAERINFTFRCAG